MNDDILISLLKLTGGKVYRRNPNEVQPTEILCSATWLGDDMWLTVADRGIYGGTVRGEWRGLLEVVDIWIKPDDVDEFIPAIWAHQTSMKPIIVLKTAKGRRPHVNNSNIASTASTLLVDYYKLVRNEDGKIYQSAIYDRPWMARYDVERETAVAMVGRCDMNYRLSKKEFGAPMLTQDGKLAGVIVGSDWGTDSSHAGFYVPVDFIIPSIDILRAMLTRMHAGESTWRIGIDYVKHESSDVDVYE